MSLSMMNEAVRIADHLCGPRDVESIERQGRLQNTIVLVFVFHMVMVVAFVSLKDLEVTNPRIVKDLDVTFVLTPLPIELLNKPQELPKEPVPVPSSNPLPESEHLQAASKGQEAKLPQSQPQVKVLQPSTGTTSSEVSHKTTNFPPVSITKNSMIAVDVKQIASRQSSQAPNSNTVSEISSWKSTFNPSNSSPSNSESSQGVDGERDSTTNGTEQVGAGTGDGQEGTIEIDTHLPNQSALFNIAPYRNALLKKLAQNWHPTRTSKKPLIVLFTIDHAGQLANLEIEQSSGSKKLDKEALDAVRATNFDPLPDAYRGESIPFRIELTNVVE